jgi:hypothetical protein
MEEMEELTLADVYLLLESLKYSRYHIENAAMPPTVKQSRLDDNAAVTAKLRALRDDMKRNPSIN